MSNFVIAARSIAMRVLYRSFEAEMMIFIDKPAAPTVILIPGRRICVNRHID